MPFLETLRHNVDVARARPRETGRALLKLVPLVNLALQTAHLEELTHSLLRMERVHGIDSIQLRLRHMPLERRKTALALVGTVCAFGAAAAPEPALRAGLAAAAFVCNGALARGDFAHLKRSERNYREANGDPSLTPARERSG